jgi:hypothetical protein
MKQLQTLLVTVVFIVMANIVNAQTDTVYVKETPDTVYVQDTKAVDRDDDTPVKHVSYNHDARNRFQLGFKAGFNHSNIYDVTSNNFAADFKYGFAGGMFLGIPIGRWIGLQPEILYSQRGYESHGEVLGAAYQNTHKSEYIDIPLLLQLKPFDYVTILGGVQYSFLISHDNSFSTSFLSADQEQSLDNLNIRKNTFCVTGGLDININHVVLGGRVGWDILDNNGDGTSMSPRYRNFWYQATLGLRF